MKRGSRLLAAASVTWLAFGAAPVLRAQGRPPVSPSSVKETVVTMRAGGTFDVKLAPLAAYDTGPGSPLARMSIDKQFHGDLEATSKGEMLAAGTAVKGSAGYVAVERVSGTLKGRRGSFILQHNATMSRGVPALSIIVVPDSGTDGLEGLTGTMQIIIENGKHSYEFDYTLPAAR